VASLGPVGIIGFGVFGRFMAEQLSPYMEVVVSSRNANPREVEAAGARLVDFSEAASQPIVVPSVPVQYLEAVLVRMVPYLRPGALVADVSSVKTVPVELMKRILPETCEILATHPLFGPQSGAGGIKGLPMVVWPQRVGDARMEKIQKFLTGTLGLDVSVISPREHDQEMAYVQALTFFLGKALGDIDIPDTPLKTKTYQHLLEVKRIVQGDTPELFETIQHFNPYAAGAREEFMKHLGTIEAELVGVEGQRSTADAAAAQL
jgi:prephenate dehydrogenase